MLRWLAKTPKHLRVLVGMSAIALSAESVPARADDTNTPHILDRSEIEKLSIGERLDFNLYKLAPETLKKKVYMQYLIARSNCEPNFDVASKTFSEFDYPTLSKFYAEHLPQVLSDVPNSFNIVVIGEHGGNVLSDYDMEKKSFTITNLGINPQPIILNKITLQLGVRSYFFFCKNDEKSINFQFPAPASSYTIEIPRVSFSELKMNEDDARKYVDQVSGGVRLFTILSTVEILPVRPNISGGSVTFSGKLKKLQLMTGDTPIGTLFEE